MDHKVHKEVGQGARDEGNDHYFVREQDDKNTAMKLLKNTGLGDVLRGMVKGPSRNRVR